MNDLYLTNGKTGHYRSLGLQKVTKVQAEWPTPQQIKLNATKRETVPVAFRIDEVAYTMLNLFAEQCELTTSAFVNELINSYINQHQHSVKGAVFKSTINLSLERFAAKLKKMPTEQVILNYHQDFLRSLIEHFTGERLPKKDISFCRIETFQEMLKENLWQYMQTAFLNCCVNICLDGDASVQDLREESQETQNTFCWKDFAMWIPVEKWIFLQPLFELYDTKCEQFLTASDWKDTRERTSYDDIVEIINKYDGAELIERMTEHLKFKENAWMKVLQK